MFTQFPTLRNKPYWGNHFWAKGYCVDIDHLTNLKLQRLRIRRFFLGNLSANAADP
jgi:REP element-mobilizing transposase RayT